MESRVLQVRKSESLSTATLASGTPERPRSERNDRSSRNTPNKENVGNTSRRGAPIKIPGNTPRSIVSTPSKTVSFAPMQAPSIKEIERSKSTRGTPEQTTPTRKGSHQKPVRVIKIPTSRTPSMAVCQDASGDKVTESKIGSSKKTRKLNTSEITTKVKKETADNLRMTRSATATPQSVKVRTRSAGATPQLSTKSETKSRSRAKVAVSETKLRASKLTVSKSENATPSKNTPSLRRSRRASAINVNFVESDVNDASESDSSDQDSDEKSDQKRGRTSRKLKKISKKNDSDSSSLANKKPAQVKKILKTTRTQNKSANVKEKVQASLKRKMLDTDTSTDSSDHSVSEHDANSDSDGSNGSDGSLVNESSSGNETDDSVFEQETIRVIKPKKKSQKQ